MANEKDILLDAQGDLLFENGDLVIGESLEQEVAMLLQVNKGEFKEDFIVGCDFIKMLKGNVSELELKKVVKIQLARDGKNYDQLKKNIITKIS